MKLAEFQSLFQARALAVSSEDDVSLFDMFAHSSGGPTPETRFAVYRDGYQNLLAGFLADDYPGLRRLLGETAFDALAARYVAASPPRRYNARYYSRGLSDFMRVDPFWGDNARAVSMALFERAMHDAFDAADAPPLGAEALSAFGPEDWPRLVFGFHPSLSLLELAGGAIGAYESKENDAPLAEQMEHVAVWRADESSVYRALAPEEYVALSEARAGRAFSDICQMAAFQQAGEIEPARVAQSLARWFADGMVIAVGVSAA